MSEKASALARFGIKVRLQAAFGAVAITTVIAAAVAIMSFSETERGFERVSTREVPMMTDALRLSVASGEISAAAARYVSAKTSDDRKLIADPDGHRPTWIRSHDEQEGGTDQQRGANDQADRASSAGDGRRSGRIRRHGAMHRTVEALEPREDLAIRFSQ